MARTKGALNQATANFFARFDKYALTYVDPLELIFQVAAKSPKAGRGWDNGHRMTAAQTLMQYRYPRLKALEITDSTEKQSIQISWLDADGEEIPTGDVFAAPQPNDLLN